MKENEEMRLVMMTVNGMGMNCGAGYISWTMGAFWGIWK